MNTRRERFCQAYARHGVGAQAAREAGYSAKTARTLAAMLLTKVDVAERVEQLRAEQREEAEHEHKAVQDALKAAATLAVETLAEVLRNPDASPSARVAAAQAILDRAGHGKTEPESGPQTIVVTGGLPLDPTK